MFRLNELQLVISTSKAVYTLSSSLTKPNNQQSSFTKREGGNFIVRAAEDKKKEDPLRQNH